MVTIAFTTLCWLLTAFLGPQTDRKVLIEFFRKIRPFGPGWTRIREEAGIPTETVTASSQNIPLALLGWVAGCTVIFSALFAVGNFLYSRMNYAFLLLGVFILSGMILLYVVKRLWSDRQV